MVDFINKLRESHSKLIKYQIMAEGIGGSEGETLASYPTELQKTGTFAGVKMRMTDWKLRGSWKRSNPSQLKVILKSMKMRRSNKEAKEKKLSPACVEAWSLVDRTGVGR
jgi:hypothetical protein